ncbi:hypothetical protein LEMLEM_LOCUS25468, partial [Lemmus lemmus]
QQEEEQQEEEQQQEEEEQEEEEQEKEQQEEQQEVDQEEKAQAPKIQNVNGTSCSLWPGWISVGVISLLSKYITVEAQRLRETLPVPGKGLQR